MKAVSSNKSLLVWSISRVPQPFLLLSVCAWLSLDCKTVRIFAYSSKREQSNERSGTRLKTESETGERR